MTTAHSAAAASDVLVKTSIQVQATPERAFRVFTEKLGSWWPLASHKIGKVEAKDAVIEPFVGGRWYERGVDGSECPWGHVLAWEPPQRLVLSWEISVDWQPNDPIQSEVEVRFVAEAGGTRVELEHRKLERYGARAEEIQKIFASPGGWPGLLEGYAALCARD